jgi:hypothetical protein
MHSDMQMQIAYPTATVAISFLLQPAMDIGDAKSIRANRHSKMGTPPSRCIRSSANGCSFHEKVVDGHARRFIIVD